MKQLIYKSNLKPDKMPAWLTCLLNITLDDINNNHVFGDSVEDYEWIQWIINTHLKELQVKSSVTTELVADEGKTALFIKRSSRILVSIYIKEKINN